MFHLDDNDKLNIKSNTRIMYIRASNLDWSPSYVRHTQRSEQTLFSNTMKPVEHVLTLDVASGKAYASHSWAQNMTQINIVTSMYILILTQTIRVPFVEGEKDYSITLYDN